MTMNETRVQVPPPPPPRTHRRTNPGTRYTFLRRLDEGGFGEVSLAWDEWLNRPVAIKRPRKSDDGRIPQERLDEVFDSERRLSPQLVHPMIVVTYESDATQVVMEYLNGPTLKKYIPGSHPQGLSLHIAMRYLVALLDVAAFLHVGKIAHRDFNPGNIILHDPRMLSKEDLVSPDMTGEDRDYAVIKVLDFGISTSTAKTSTNTPGKKARCPPFGPPEADPKARGDLYQLGALGIYMLSGEQPSSGDDSCPDEWLAILDDLYSKRRAVSRRLYKVLRRAIMKDPSMRYETAEEFRAALLASSQGAVRRLAGENALAAVRYVSPLFVVCAGLIVIGENALTCSAARRDLSRMEAKPSEGDVDIVSRIALPLPPLQETCPEIDKPEMIEMWNKAKTYNEDVWGHVQTVDVADVKRRIQDLNMIVLAHPRCDATLALRGQLCLARVRIEHDINNHVVGDEVRQQLINCKTDLERASTEKEAGHENAALAEIHRLLGRTNSQYETGQTNPLSQIPIIDTLHDGTLKSGGSRPWKKPKDDKGDTSSAITPPPPSVEDTPPTVADTKGNTQRCKIVRFKTICD